MLVVGGGDSAIEAACQLAEQPGCTVTLSYRGHAYARARAKNRERIARLVEDGRIEELLASHVIAIEPAEVTLDCQASCKTWGLRLKHGSEWSDRSAMGPFACPMATRAAQGTARCGSS